MQQEKLTNVKSRREEKEEETDEYSIGWEIKEKVCPRTRKAVTRVTTREERRKRHHERTCSWRTEMLSESEDSGGGYWKSKSKKQSSSIEDEDLSQPWVCGEIDPFTSRICYFDLPKKTRMPNNVKTYDGSDDPEDHLKIFQAVAKQHEAGRKQNFDRRGDFRNQQRSEQRRDKFTLLTKSPKEIFALDKGKFKAPPPMTTPVEKRNNNKFCEFHGEVGHNTDECMHLRRQIEELIKNGKLSHVIKELKQGSGKDQPKAAKKRETSEKDKPLAILMVQPWQRVARQKITQSFFPNPKISFPPLGDEDGTEGPMIIEAEIGGHFIHRMYVDGGSASEILYEHCFNRLRLEVKNQMVPATAPLIGFSGEIIWPIGQIMLPVKIGDADYGAFHLYMDEFYGGGILTLRSSRIIPLECMMVSGPEAQPSDVVQAAEERIKVAIHSEYPEKTIAIGSTLTEEGRKALMLTSQTKEKKSGTRKRQSNTRGGGKTGRRRHNERSPLSQLLVGNQKNKSNKEELENVRGFQRPEQGMPLMTIICYDFIVERPEEDSLVTTTEVEEEPPELWTLFTDGSSCVDGSGAALIAGLRIAEQMGVQNLQTNVDSRYSFAHLTKQVLVEELNEKSVNETEVLAVVEEEGDTWMTPIYNYLTKETLLAEKEKARVVRYKSRWYAVINGVLYKKSYLGSWLRDNSFKDWCEKLCIRQHFAFVKHPQANGLVERANKSLGEGIKAWLDERSKDWIEDILHVLWAHRTMIKSTETDMVQNDEALEINLDLLEERKEQVAIREARSKAKMEKYYNSNVCNTSFKPGDLVYRNNDASHAKDSRNFSPKWEGPYEVTEALGSGAYKLRDHNRKLLSRTWNIRNLKNVRRTTKDATMATGSVGSSML
ncbi:reverse transcriptase domain-containing protein [Tanacetum coccineum]|uniref:Reverse transcriptase domain-containing protein n=1 Tax=Tanacetum coccineum TaxID=301880 RepID=A0ABQ4YGE6_9ASTR